MKLAAYVRVSSAGQADGFGLEVQEQQARQWAKAHGHRVVSVHRDVITGTSDALDRPGLTEALNAVQDGTAEGIVVARLDRLARALHVQEAALTSAWRAGGRVFAADQGEVLQDDPDDPLRTFIRQVLGAVAQLDRAMLTKRMRDGQLAKKASGEGRWAGRKAYGEHPGEDALVARVVALRAEGLSYPAIARTLPGEGFQPRSGGAWHCMQVRRIAVRAGAA